LTEKIEKAKTPQIYWELEVKDKNGKVISKNRVAAKSWLKAFIAMLKGHFGASQNAHSGNANSTIVDEQNNSRACPYVTGSSIYGIGCSALAGVTSESIIVGSGNTANTITTYALTTKIAHGTGANQLLYGASSIEDVTNPSGNDLQFRITRVFTNNSGSTITVKEIGILMQEAVTGGSFYPFLAARDVLPSPTDVPDGATLTIRYVVKITVA